MKQSLKKRLIRQAGRNAKIPDLTGASFPPNKISVTAKSLGNPVVELATSNGTINLSEGTNKNDLGVLGHFRTPGRLDEKRNTHKSGRTDRNWSEVFRIHKL
ncbi:MAG: hypothetical protein V7L14_32215 [Nostoc sp.]|uniref:hypothetical protein n=1 Tax=Nostoc sp. TaxID=1180 RepID=UPI002FF794D5